ncbi:MAG: gamma-glutamylcyclotransferase [Bradymonadia bacterium]
MEKRQEATWVFGYGSLIWRPDFPFVEKKTARLNGYARRFWQGSPDHRGTIEHPGRVVTLVPVEGAVCHGMAFQLAPSDVSDIIEALDFRESGGYTRTLATIDIGHCVEAIVYIANPHNAHFLGTTSLENMAIHINRSIGPSGTNYDYLKNLADSLAQFDIQDSHIIELLRTCDALKTT